MMNRARIAAVVAGAAALVGILAVAASAQPYPPPAPLLTIDLTIVTPGATINLQGDNWGPGTFVEIIRTGGAASSSALDAGTDDTGDAGTDRSASGTDGGEVLARIPVGADGTFRSQVTLPSDIEGGEHVLVADGVDSADEPQSTTAALTVQDDPAGGDDGFGAREVLLIAAGLLVLIALGLVVARRRATS